MSGMNSSLYGRIFRKLNFEEAQENGRRFFEFIGANTLEEARSIDAVTLRDKYEQFKGSFGTVADNVFLPDISDKCLMKGERNMVPLMIGHTSTEFFTEFNAKNMEEFRQEAKGYFGEDAEEFVRLCGDDYESAMKNARTCSIEIAYRALKANDEAHGVSAPIYYYYFDSEIPGDKAGTFHSSDLWFFFESLAKCWRPFVGKHYDLSRQMCNYWVNYFKCGDPNGLDADGSQMPLWKPFTTKDADVMRFGDTSEPIQFKPSEVVKLLIKVYQKKMAK